MISLILNTLILLILSDVYQQIIEQTNRTNGFNRVAIKSKKPLMP